jgi:hypothetical protein
MDEHIPAGFEVTEAEEPPVAPFESGPYRVVSSVHTRRTLTIRWRPRRGGVFGARNASSITIDGDTVTASTGPSPLDARFEISIADVAELAVVEPLDRAESWRVVARDRTGRLHELARVDRADDARWLIRRLGLG